MATIDKPVRKSLPLSPRDVEDLATLRASTMQRGALADLAGVEVTDATSEAALLKAVWEAGMRAVRERAEEHGYAQIAADREAAAERRAVARRRPPSWADEP